MSKPFDATTKHLIALRPGDWLALLGMPSAPVEVIDADLATVTTDADRVLRVGDPPERLVHFEFESGKGTAAMGRRLLRYSVLLDYQNDLPVESAVVLLRRESDSPQITGRIERLRADGSIYLAYSYQVVRIWEWDPNLLLAGGLGTIPLAPLTKVMPEELPIVVQQMEARIAAEASEEDAKALWASTYVLMGLRYSRDVTNTLLKGVRQMKESVTYQAILEEGRQEGRRAEAHRLILRLGENRFGKPNASTAAALQAIASLERLEALLERMPEVENWGELLA